MVKHDGSDKGFLRVLIKKLRSRDPFRCVRKLLTRLVRGAILPPSSLLF